MSNLVIFTALLFCSVVVLRQKKLCVNAAVFVEGKRQKHEFEYENEEDGTTCTILLLVLYLLVFNKAIINAKHSITENETVFILKKS